MNRFLVALLAFLAFGLQPAAAGLLLNSYRFGTAAPARSYTYGGSSAFGTGSSATYTAAPLGTADATRVIVVTVSVRGGGTTSFSGVTIGGNAATQAVETSSTNDDAAIYYLAVAAGTSADIVVSFSSSQSNGLIGVYSVYNLDASTPNATASGTAGTATISASTDDIVIATATKRAVSSATWTGVTEDGFSNPGSYFSTASLKRASGISSVSSALDQISATVWR